MNTKTKMKKLQLLVLSTITPLMVISCTDQHTTPNKGPFNELKTELTDMKDTNSISSQNTFTSDALSKWKGMKSYTLKVAEAMPEDKYNYKPVADVRVFADQLVHMANNIYKLSAMFLRDSKPPVNLKLMAEKVSKGSFTKAEIITYVTNAFDYGAESMKLLDATQLEEEISFWGGIATKRKIVLLLHDHQTHHRAQMIMYLRLNDITPPSYIGW